MDTKRSENDLRLLYVVRGTPPTTFSGLKEKLHHRIPIDVSSAAYVCDWKIIFMYLDISKQDTTARAWLETDNHRKNHDGRGVWIQVKHIGEGDNKQEECICEQQEKFDNTRYMGHGRCNAKKTTFS